MFDKYKNISHFFEFVFLHVFLFKNVYCEIYVYIYI